MTLEIRITGNEEILLNPYKKQGNDQTDQYQLLDNQNFCWLEAKLINGSFEITSQDARIIEDPTDLNTKLDKLALEVLEAEQSGTENTESSTVEEVNPYNPDNIKVHSKQFSIKLIEEMIDNEDIDFTPDFQRNFVWNNVQKSRLIESILLRIPLPMFYFSEDDDGKISVVDGLQRLTTIKDFMDNKFPLKSLEYLKNSCEGLYYSSKDKFGNPNGKKSIEAKYFRWFNMTQFSVNVIDPTSPPKVKYDIFRRINTGGKPLNSQEIRNCLAGKSLRTLLREMTALPEFKKATDFSIKSTRMDDHEVALRFILFYKLKHEDADLNNYSGYMDHSLDELTEEISKKDWNEINHYKSLFSNAMKNAEHLFGKKFAFRKVMPSDLLPYAHKQLINKALFVCWSVLLADLDPETIQSKNEPQVLLNIIAERISEDYILRSYLSYGTNSKANLIYAFKECTKIISNNLNL